MKQRTPKVKKPFQEPLIKARPLVRQDADQKATAEWLGELHNMLSPYWSARLEK